MVQTFIRLVSPPASKQTVYYMVMSAFFLFALQCAQPVSIFPQHIKAKEQIYSIKSTDSIQKTGGASDPALTHRQADYSHKDSVSFLQLCLREHHKQQDGEFTVSNRSCSK